jgi:hypothetical protein
MGELHCTKAIGFLMARSHAHGAVITDILAFGILRWLTGFTGVLVGQFPLHQGHRLPQGMVAFS